MISNPITDAMMNRKSIRKYQKTMPGDEEIETVVRAGQQAPFAYQLGSLLLSRGKKHPFGAPLLFTICVDAHRMETMMARRGWKMLTNDLSLLFFGIQDAAYMAQNMVIAAESLGMGSCFLGATPYQAGRIIRQYSLPKRVFPLVQLVMGYPAESPPPRPRYPLNFFLFEDTYPEFDEETVQNAMRVMDEGYLAQNYYRRANYMIRLENDRPETFTIDNYSWTEHISRKAGQWLADLNELIEPLRECGFHIEPEKSDG